MSRSPTKPGRTAPGAQPPGGAQALVPPIAPGLLDEEGADFVWRDLADELWTQLPAEERQRFIGKLETVFLQALRGNELGEQVAYWWLARLTASEPMLREQLERNSRLEDYVTENLSSTVAQWLRDADGSGDTPQLVPHLAEGGARLTLAQALVEHSKQVKRLPRIEEDREAITRRALAQLENPQARQGLIQTTVRPVERELYRAETERLRSSVRGWLDASVGGGVAVVVPASAASLAEAVAMARYIPTLSGQAMQTVDRAVRGPSGWHYPEDDAPTFLDPTNEHTVMYQEEGYTLEALRRDVMALNPRTADVWRLVTARSLERWQEGQLEPPAVWVDVRELLEAMGYKKAKKGGFKQEHVEGAAKALVDLERLYLVIPKGAKEYPLDPKSRTRKAVMLEHERSYRVLSVVAKDELRDLFGTRYPMRWQVRPGEWIKGYPRQFAPLLAAIVELSAQGTVNVWAKALGTELTYQYRQDRNRTTEKVLTVRRLLQRAVLLPEVEAWAKQRNSRRAREYFDEAMDTLKRLGVCEGWEYNAEDFDAIERGGNKRWLERWFEARVVITAPKWLIEKLPELPVAAPPSASKGKRPARSNH